MGKPSALRLGKELVDRLQLPETLPVSEARLVVNATGAILQLDVILTDLNLTRIAEALQAATKAEGTETKAVEIYTQPHCIFEYCGTPEICRVAPGGCMNPRTRASHE